MFDRSSLLSRRKMLQGAAAMAAAAVIPGCSSGTGASTTTVTVPPGTKPNPQPVPSGPVTGVPVVLSANVLGTISSSFMGICYDMDHLAYPGWTSFTTANTGLVNLLKLLGPGVLRLGGPKADVAVWVPSGTSTAFFQKTPLLIQQLAAFLKATGWQCIYAINLPTATPASAAAEMTYVASQLGSSLIGVEMGNEPNLYGQTGNFFTGNWSVQQDVTLWQSFRTAISAAVPGIKFVGPATSAADGTLTDTPLQLLNGWTVPFVQSVGSSQLGMITQHYYRGHSSVTSNNGAWLVSPDTQLPGVISALNSLSAQNGGIPWRMDELSNLTGGGTSGVSDTYAATLWIIDALFQLAIGGAAGVNVTCSNGGYYPPFTDDYASGAITAVMPEYYGMLMFALAGTGSILTTTISPGSLNVTAYSVKTATGQNIVIVNKDPTQNALVTVQALKTVNTASLLQLIAPSLSSTAGSVTIQGSTVSTAGAFSPGTAYTLTPSYNLVDCYVPAQSAVLMTIT